MPKGYLVANIRIHDAEKFKEFAAMAGPAIKKTVARFWLEDHQPTDMKALLLALL